MKKIDITVADITRQAFIAAVYAAVCLLLAPLSFGNTGIEFRFAEALMILPYFNKKHVFGLTLGCLLTNLFSPVGLPDIIFGTLATLLACVLITKFRNKWAVVPIATLVNAVVVGALLFFEGFVVPFWLAFTIVGAGELVVVTVGVCAAVFVEKSAPLTKVFRS